MSKASRIIQREALENAAYELNIRAATQIPPDYEAALRHVFRTETNPVAKNVLGAMVDGIAIQRDEKRPICGDTGIPRYFVKLANNVRIEGGLVALEEALRSGLARATQDVPLRSNRCHPLTRQNPGSNIGVFAPNIDYSVEPGEGWIEITATHKGGAFGTDFRMHFAGEGVDAVKRCVAKSVAAYGQRGLSCQPTIVGVGVGGTKDQAMSLGKMACMLRTVGDRHPDPVVANLEDELAEICGESGLGVMGLPGKGFAVDVHVEIAYTHSAFLPIAVHHQCQAVRRATVRLSDDERTVFRTDPRWFTPYYRRASIGYLGGRSDVYNGEVIIA